MSADEHGTEVVEGVEDLIRTGLLLGTRVASKLAKDRAQRLQDAARESAAAAAAEKARQDAEKEAALGSLTGVNSNAWWDHADADDIRKAWQTARQYQTDDARAGRGVWTISDQLKGRYGLDTKTVDPAAFGTRAELPERTLIHDDELRAYDRELARLRGKIADVDQTDKTAEKLADIDQARGAIRDELELNAAEQPTAGEQRRKDQQNTVKDITTVGAGADVAWDSAERREALAEHLNSVTADKEAIEAVLLADVSQATPPQAATLQKPGDSSQEKASSPVQNSQTLSQGR